MAGLHSPPCYTDPASWARPYYVLPKGRVMGQISYRICRNCKRKDLGWIFIKSVVKIGTMEHRNGGMRITIF